MKRTLNRGRAALGTNAPQKAAALKPPRRLRGSRSGKSTGLSAVEALVLVSVSGVLFAVFVPSFVRNLRLSKTSEATSELVRLDQHVRAYYSRGHSVAGRGPTKHFCLPAPAGPTPAEGKKDPVTTPFVDASDPTAATWQALGYAPAEPFRFRYTFVPVGAGCSLHGAHLWSARAEGDLDGDGKYSRFERATGERKDGSLEAVGILVVRDRTE